MYFPQIVMKRSSTETWWPWIIIIIIIIIIICMSFMRGICNRVPETRVSLLAFVDKSSGNVRST
jgi:type II secretory pathway component PulF